MKKQVLSLLLVLVLIATSIPFTAFAEGTTTITIFHTNDMHANMIGDTAAGAANLAVVKAIADTVPDSLLLDGGDATQGQPYCLLSKGYDIIQLMNAAGYDAMCIGNHEFDYGEEAMLKNFAAADFPVLAANLSFTDEAVEGLADVVKDFEIFEVKGKNIAVIGLAGLDTMSTVAPGSRPGIQFEDYFETVDRELALIEAWENETGKNVDLKVVLSHMGYLPEDTSSTYWVSYFAEHVEGIDIIIDAHSHTDMLAENSVTINDTLIVSAGGYLNELGRLDITFDEDGSFTAVSTNVLPASVDGTTPQDPAVLSMIEEIRRSEESLRELVIGQAGEHIDKHTVLCLVADALRWQAQQDINDPNAMILGYICLGNILHDLDEGEITMGDAFAAIPWGSPVKYMELTPNMLYQMVEVGLRNAVITEDGHVEPSCGAFMYGSGFSYVADITKSPTIVNDATGEQVKLGCRVCSITLDDGTVLDRNDRSTRIIMPSCKYNLTGGDGFWCLVDNVKILDESISQEQVFAQYIDHLMKQEGFENGLYNDLIDTDRFYLSSKEIRPNPGTGIFCCHHTASVSASRFVSRF